MKLKGVPTLEGKHFPVLGAGLMFKFNFIISDPEMCRQILTVQNQKMDKDALALMIFKPLIGEAFLVQGTNDDWMSKRKACAHAFYKERIKMMMGTLQG